MGFFDDVRDAGRAGLRAAALRWVRESDDDVSFDEMESALAKGGLASPGAQKPTIAQPTNEVPRAMFHDPYSVTDWGGWRQRPSAMTYETLRLMAQQNTVIGAIINLRVNQLAQFARPQQDRYERGFRIVLRDRRDRSRSMTKAEEKRATEIERMLETTGFLLPGEKPQDRDSFRTFLKKSVRDVLTYDQWCFEKLRDRNGRPSRFICLPSETIRPAVVDVEHQSVQESRERVAYVQTFENSVIAEFGVDELAWCIMNPRSDLRANNFGLSPVEQIVRLVTAWLYGFEYNQRFFSQGSAIKGLINIKGTIPDKQMRAFRRMWYQMVSGVQNAWRTPILNSEEIQWVSMHSNNREMEYSAWMDWLTKLICAIYGVDPIEINFQFGNTGQSSTLNQGSQEEKVVESKDKGLRPLIDHIVDHINQHLVWELEPDFEFSFAGLDAKAEETERKGVIELTKSVLTVNEGRAKLGEEPLPGELGNVILDNNWTAWAQQQMQPQPDGMGAEGVPGEGGADGLLSDPEPQADDDLLAGPPDSGDDDGDDDLLAAQPAKGPKVRVAMMDDDDDDLLARSERVRVIADEQLRKAQRSMVLNGDRQAIEIIIPREGSS
jgi:HK97 family phage portal protein